MSQVIFTAPQIIALDAIAEGASITEAAAQAGVHRNTISNWRRESTNFQIALANAQYDRALVFREKAEALAGLAFETLRSLLSDSAASPSVRCKAAQYILNLVTTQMDLQKKVQLTVADYIDASPPKVHNSAQSEETPEPAPAPQTIRPDRSKIGRNQICPCGSGLKYKRCCLDKPAAPAAGWAQAA